MIDMLPEPEKLFEYGDWALDAFGLEPALRMVELWHTPNLGYHNLCHTYVTMSAAVKIAMDEGHNPKLSMIAAMFHDMGHTGKQPDDQNINRAVTWLARAVNMKLLDITSTEWIEVKQAIESTVYMNGEFPVAPRSNTARILRDADLWNPHLHPDNALWMIRGLGRELGAWDQDTLGAGIDNTIKFFRTVQWHTETARALSSDVEPRLQHLHMHYLES